MTRQELIDLCLTYPDAYEDYPFDEVKDEKAWTVMRHLQNRKSFAMIFERGRVVINLKCDPAQADHLRQLFDGVTPAYHMNKTHWNSVDPNSDVPPEVLEDMIDASYRLTKPTAKARK